MKRLYFSCEREQNQCANQNLVCGSRALLSAAQPLGRVQVCLQTSLSHTRLPRWNKEAFHVDLDTQPPPSTQEPKQRNPPQLSDINLSVPLADASSSRPS